MFSRDSSLQSDKVKEASEVADDLLSSTNVARRETLDTLQQIELVEVSYIIHFMKEKKRSIFFAYN